MSADDTWSANSNDTLVLSLVAPSETGGLKTVASFHPQFTYTVFGEDEQIFGYQGLNINLRFNASDMRPNLGVTYSKKFKAIGETEAANINAILHDCLPEVAFQKGKEFEAALQHIPADWTPPGELVTSFTSDKTTYEVWKGNLADLAVNQLVKRIQILVPLFIEGGTFIPLDEPDTDRWTIFFLYEKRLVLGAEDNRFSYIFAGYCTVYRFFLFRAPPTPPASPPRAAAEEHNGGGSSEKELSLGGEFDLSQLPCRSRISQFIVIPPFQGKGLGPRLYGVIFQEYYQYPPTFEITVEDPNEAFDDMRDIADLHFLRELPEFNALHIDTGVKIPKDGMAPANIMDGQACEAVRRKAKIAPRQFYRVLEMHLMSKLPEPVRPSIAPEKLGVDATPAQEHEYKLWRLMVKKRIYVHNKDALGQLELGERIEKLGETASSVEFDFARLLFKAAAQKTRLLESSGADGMVSNGKRKVDGEECDLPAGKRARVESAEEE
ncbi:acyl-CoA N-acyltransferase [Apodospora peruviana]|uniref:Histone acetyltransferase type B catalytic subunit n=1 Tax=Apodospora peruviana TaxID=516989 RepID=A0AAE0IDX1_9PEZI|nr:acyl-CoA N-acyltransferase [Apodospora peruviana]